MRLDLLCGAEAEWIGREVHHFFNALAQLVGPLYESGAIVGFWEGTEDATTAVYGDRAGGLCCFKD